MELKRLIAAMAAPLVVAACGTSDPTAPAVEVFEAEVAYNRGAVVDPDDHTTVDANENLRVCMKVVAPSSDEASHQAGPRVIWKDDTDGTCPGGFTLTVIEVPPGDPG